MKLNFLNNNLGVNIDIKKQVNLIHGVSASGVKFNVGADPSKHDVEIKCERITVDFGDLSLPSVMKLMRVFHKLDSLDRSTRRVHEAIGQVVGDEVE
jgi:hypothetical protein